MRMWGLREGPAPQYRGTFWLKHPDGARECFEFHSRIWSEGIKVEPAGQHFRNRQRSTRDISLVPPLPGCCPAITAAAVSEFDVGSMSGEKRLHEIMRYAVSVHLGNGAAAYVPRNVQ